MSLPHLRTTALSVCLLLATTLTAQKTAQKPPVSSELPARYPHGIVVSVHHDAADAGVEILKAGGNAVDAAVATGFALAVVHPAAGNIGGGGFMLIRLASGEAHFLDYREKAPAAATADMYLNPQHHIIPLASTVGYKAVGVPGSVAGMVEAERRWGKLTLKQVMAPSIRLAENGFQLTEDEALQMKDQNLALFSVSRRIFQRGGDYYVGGDTFKQPELAETLRRIAEDPGDFYHGKMAKELAAGIQHHGGLITEEDLANYQVKDREPLVGTYRDLTIITAPPPSSGGITLLQTLNMLEPYDLAKLGDRTPQYIHLVTEAFRRAYFDRTDYLGDPDFAAIPTEQMIDRKYADAWRATIDENKATPSKDLKRPEGFLPPPPTTAKPTKPEHKETTHFSVVDADGNAVAVTTTLNGAWGSYAASELGFLLNNEMDDFASQQGTPNQFGLIQGPNNAIGPGKRPLSSMTPTIVIGTEDKKLRLVLGSPGGGRIPTTVANILLSVVDGKLNIQDAVDAPRFHHQYLPDTLVLEPGIPPETADALTEMGYTVANSSTKWSDGECIAIDPRTNERLGGQDHRHHYGKAAGY